MASTIKITMKGTVPSVIKVASESLGVGLSFTQSHVLGSVAGSLPGQSVKA